MIGVTPSQLHTAYSMHRKESKATQCCADVLLVFVARRRVGNEEPSDFLQAD